VNSPCAAKNALGQRWWSALQRPMPGRFFCLRRGAQATAHEAVEDAEQSRGGVLEVAEPTPKHRVEVGDEPREAVASAAAGLRPHLVLERLQALLADQPTTGLGPVAQELEASPRLSAVADPRLVRVEGEAVGRHPRLDLAEGGPRLGFAAAQDHEVSGAGGTVLTKRPRKAHPYRRKHRGWIDAVRPSTARFARAQDEAL
jgi:hypothetical protein